MEYKIVSIVPLVDITPQGKFVKFYRVRFTFNDIEDYVDVPEDKYNPEYVRKLVEERVRSHAELLR